MNSGADPSERMAVERRAWDEQGQGESVLDEGICN